MTINCLGKLINLNQPKVMGILNITPDSFYDGGKLVNKKMILKQVEKMLLQGATFLDIGGYSTRPGASDISTQEELQRVLPAISAIVAKFPSVIISIDTFRSEIAKAAVEAGAAMVNDISGGSMDSNMLATVGKLNVPYIGMHIQGTPKNMQLNPSYKNVTVEVRETLSKMIASARRHKIIDVIADVGFGFGKTIKHNYQLLAELNFFKELEVPILVGLSRKSMIYKVLESSPEKALNGTTALHSIALLKGANILRVHDVAAAVDCIKLIAQYKIAADNTAS